MSWKATALYSIGKVLDQPVELMISSAVGGGDINEAYRFETSAGIFLVKKNHAGRYPQMFEKEARGLALLASAKEIPVPFVVSHGEVGEMAFLVLKFIESAGRQPDFWDDFGQRLARLHKHTDTRFGLDHDNYIGSLYQSNRQHDRWTDFFREERLGRQVKMARDSGAIDRGTVSAFERFYQRLPEIFPEEPPALLHGDLWAGNFMENEFGHAVIIDPAVYYGHREMDLGMSRLFGGFADRFYGAYQEQYPLQPGWEKRLDYCNLYPLMVHVNLFGGGYLQSVRLILGKFR